MCKLPFIQSLNNREVKHWTYSEVSSSKGDKVNANVKYYTMFELKFTDKKTLHTMYWFLKMHKAPVQCHFVVASKQCSSKPLTKTIFKYFYDETLSWRNFSEEKPVLFNFQKL